MDDSTARRVLGVGPYASHREAHEAYKRRAKMIHPDRHAHAEVTARREAERAMRELTEAWHTVKHAKPPPPGIRYERPAEQERRPPRPTACELCGHLPAVPEDVRALTGILLIHHTDRYAGTLCRNCGTSLCRDVQSQTLTLGWWGVPALFVNLAVLVNNAAYFRALRELPWPRERSAEAHAPLSQPQPLTKTVISRPLPWLATVTAAVVVVFGIVLLLISAR
jgi:hypothetical protein